MYRLAGFGNIDCGCGVSVPDGATCPTQPLGCVAPTMQQTITGVLASRENRGILMGIAAVALVAAFLLFGGRR